MKKTKKRPTKKAVLVSFSIMTRVVVDNPSDVPSSQIEDAAIKKALEKIRKDPYSYITGDNCDEVSDDTEDPYNPKFDGK